MLYEKIANDFNNSSDLKFKKINNTWVIYLESITNSDKINEYILKNLVLKKRFIYLRDVISGPSVVILTDKKQINFYLTNGFAIVFKGKEIIACEVKGDLFRSVSEPTVETSVNGPKDSFNENIVNNLGLIKRRIKDNHLINDDYILGSKLKNKMSLLYIDNLVDKKRLKILKRRINNCYKKEIFDSEVLGQFLSDEQHPFPTILKTERPDRVVTALMEGKMVIIVDNSPFALIMPAFLIDFINPQGDKYVRAININLLKILRLFCFLITIFLPAFYISIINYNPESVPLTLLLSFQSARNGVPFPSSFEAIMMIFLCSILRETDIRFPSNYGSSVSIIGALILGEAAVAANIVSPIMIIIIGITFITGLAFTNGELIHALMYYRLLILLLTILLGLYGLILGMFILVINLCSIKSLDINYLFPLAPFEGRSFFKTFLKKVKK